MTNSSKVVSTNAYDPKWSTNVWNLLTIIMVNYYFQVHFRH